MNNKDLYIAVVDLEQYAERLHVGELFHTSSLSKIILLLQETLATIEAFEVMVALTGVNTHQIYQYKRDLLNKIEEIDGIITHQDIFALKMFISVAKDFVENVCYHLQKKL